MTSVIVWRFRSGPKIIIIIIIISASERIRAKSQSLWNSTQLALLNFQFDPDAIGTALVHEMTIG